MRPIEANAGCLGHLEVHFEIATRWRRGRRGWQLVLVRHDLGQRALAHSVVNEVTMPT